MDLLTGPALAGLTTIPGIGMRRAHALAEHFLTWDHLARAADWEFIQVLGKAAGRKFVESMPEFPPSATLPTGVTVISRYESDYPERLASIADPPLLIWCLGTVPPNTHKAVAIVGTRQPTAYGTSVVTLAAQQAAAREIVVISGLAPGIDSLAHTAALDAGGSTWAWLGQGVDTVPNGPRGALARRIVEAGGGLLAEVPCGTPYGPSHLLTNRNRLQSGSANGVLIAQTGVPGKAPAGTLHTARYAILQQRLLAAPRPTGMWAREERSAGNLALTDPNGCDPAVLYAQTDRETELIAARTPVVDMVLNGRDGLPDFFNALTQAVEPQSSVTFTVKQQATLY